MAENTVKIKFEPDGDQSLVRAIRALDKETKKLLNTQAKIVDSNTQNTRSTKRQSDSMRRLFVQLKANGKSFRDLGLSTDVLTKAFKGNRIAIEKARIAMRKLKKDQEKVDVATRILGGTFAVLRSKLLLVGFAVGTIARPILNIVNLTTRLESVSQAFDTLSGGTTKSSIAMNKLKEATDNTMSSFDLFKQANNAMILGVTKNSSEMAEMFDIAQRLGKALGRDTASSVESLITGIGRQSRLMLDNIGIIVKSEEAYEKYAKSIGKTASNLTDSEKKQAFFNATMESARAKVNSLGDESLTTQDVFAQLGVALEEAGVSIGTTLTPAIITMSEALRAGAVTAKGFFDIINSIFGLGEKAEELPIKTQITILEANLQSLADKGLINIDRSMSLFGDTMEKLPFNQSIFSLTEFGIQSALTQQQVNDLVEELNRLSEAQDIQFQVSAESFDIDTAKKAQEEIKKIRDERKEEAHMAKKVADEIKAVAKELADEEKRLQREKEAVRRAVLGQTTDFQLQELKNLERAFLEHNISTLESEQFFADARAEIHKKELEERMEREREQSEQLVQNDVETVSLLVNSLNGLTDAYAKNIESRKQNELNALRDTAKFQNASSEERLNMEHKINKKYAKEEQRLFGMKKISALGQIFMDTATAVTKAIPNKILMGIIAGMGMFQASIVASQQPPTYKKGGLLGGKSHSQGGTIIEAEKGEFVINKKSVSALGLPFMNAINSYENGGKITTDQRLNNLIENLIKAPTFEGMINSTRFFVRDGERKNKFQNGGFIGQIENEASLMGNQTSQPVVVNISAPLVDDSVVDSIIPAINKALRSGRANIGE